MTYIVKSPRCGPRNPNRSMPNLRVCHIGFNFFPGQGLTIFYEFARHQAMQGLDVVAIAPGRPGEPKFEIVDGVKVHRIPLTSIGRYSLDRLRFVWQAARILGGYSCDVVHTYAFVGAGLLPLLCKQSDAIWLYDCQTSAIKPPLIGLQNFMIRQESRPFDAVSVLSEGIRKIVFGANRPVDAIVPLGADFDLFQPRPPDPELLARYSISNDDCVFTYCGTLDRNRKIYKLLEAFVTVAQQEPTARLIMVGDGSALDDLRGQARSLGLENRVIFTGLVPYSAVPAYLSITTVALAFVSMDACFEHQPPTKTVEYLALGLPVIATNTSGNRMFIRDRFNGALCDDSAGACGAAMLELLRSPEQRRRLAANARESAGAFDWREIIRARVIPLYCRLLDSRLLRR